MNRPLLFDGFCGASGAGKGYENAGWHTVGCDIDPKPLRHNPHECYQGDVLTVLDTLLDGGMWHGYRLSDFQAIHCSPPCQEYTVLRARHPEKHYPDLIMPTRERLLTSGKAWIIENVIHAPLNYGVMLCGGMFGLRTYRHRRFESSHLIFQPSHPRHTVRTATKQRRAAWDAGMNVSITGSVGTYLAREAMGIDWMTSDGLSQAIPPAYTHWLGVQLLRAIGADCEVA